MLALRLMYARVTWAMERASCLTLTASAPKSCTAPMKMEPRMIHSTAGSQPKTRVAKMGPTMGPAPAMELKWWPTSTGVRVGQ